LELDVPGIRYADTAPCLLTAQSWRRVAARQ
jgi:hypothetical protein